MTTRSPKEVGYVVPLSGITRGFTVCVTRYPNGRLLPAPRTILDTSGDKPRPFASVLAALDALALWKAGPRAVKPLRPTDSVDLAAPEPVAKRVLRVARESERREAPTAEASGNLTKTRKLSPAARKRRAARVARAQAKPALPEVVKLMPACPTQIIRDRRTKTQALLAMLEASGQAKVVTYQESTRRNYVPKHGGVLPAHLNPVVMA